MLGTPVDLSKIDRDAYVIAGIADHLCAWQSCYRTTQLLGGTSRFVLSTSGHIASMVNPPGNPKASFRVAPERAAVPTPADAERWLADAGTEQGSWWPDHLQWLATRSGAVRDAPPELGGRGLHRRGPRPRRVRAGPMSAPGMQESHIPRRVAPGGRRGQGDRAARASAARVGAAGERRPGRPAPRCC